MGSGNLKAVQLRKGASCHGDANFFFLSLLFPLFGVGQEEAGRLHGGFISSKMGSEMGRNTATVSSVSVALMYELCSLGRA